jgi:hypothetical protein
MTYLHPTGDAIVLRHDPIEHGAEDVDALLVRQAPDEADDRAILVLLPSACRREL